jgi:hypothetical protein
LRLRGGFRPLASKTIRRVESRTDASEEKKVMKRFAQGVLLLLVLLGGASCAGGETSGRPGTGGATGTESGGAAQDGSATGGSSGDGGSATGGSSGAGGGAELTIPRGRPRLNAARTTFVAENGQPLRGPYTSSEWGDPAPYDQIESMKSLGFNALHLYAECFDIKYPEEGSTAPGYSASRIDSVVQATRDLGLYLVMTIGNGANNGNYNSQYVIDFWEFYAPRYADEAHVIYEIQNEPVGWSPPYSASSANPPGAMDMEIAAYDTIRKHAPDTPVLLFSYSVLWGSGAGEDALEDIRIFNQAVFGSQNADWDKLAVGFHGYAGAGLTAEAVRTILGAGYPVFMTEFGAGTWGGRGGGLDVELTADLERFGVSWLAFAYVPPWGVSDDVSKPEAYKDRVDNSGLSWTPDFGSWPAARGVYGNDGFPWATPEYNDNRLSGTLRIQAENFDDGGKGVAYYNANATNPGGQFRTDETVGIETASDTGGGYSVGWIAAGDWLEYTMKIPAAGTYDLRLRVAGMGDGRVQVLAGGVDLTGEWTLPNTGGWQTWTTATKNVLLAPGRQKLRINVLAAGFNLSWIELSPTVSGPIADGIYTFRNADNGLLLSVNANNTVITGSSSEEWNMEHIGGGQYKVSLAENGSAWDTWAGPLHLTGWWGAGGDRSFIILPTGGSNYRIVPAGSGLCLQPSSDNPPTLEQEICSGSNAQQWAIQRVR